jgi:hypothetical protein
MSSTEEAAKEIERVFDESVVSAAEALRARGVRYFEPAAAGEAASYFSTRTRRALDRDDFEWPVVSSPDELAARLRDLWAGQPEILGLVDAFVRLAKPPDASAESDGSVSDLIYPMY